MDSRWIKYSPDSRKTYVDAIKALGSLSSLFRQKSDDPNDRTTFISSKYQETAFAQAMNGRIVDRGNDPYDVMIPSATPGKFDLVGIKTFLNTSSAMQKIMQFKAVANSEGWSSWIADGEFQKLIRRISQIRNQKLLSTQSVLAGPNRNIDEIFESFYYHYLSPAHDGTVFVGEASYDLIDETCLSFEEPRRRDKVTSLVFFDGRHRYKYTPADSTLYMEFNHRLPVMDGGDLVDQFFVAEITDPHDFLVRTVRQEVSPIEQIISDRLPSAGNEVESQTEELANYHDSSQRNYDAPEDVTGVIVSQASEADSLPETDIYKSEESRSLIPEQSIQDTEPYVVFPIFSLTGYRETPAGEVLPRSGLNVRLGAPKNRGSNTRRPRNEVEIRIPRARLFHQNFPNFFGVTEEGKSLATTGRDGSATKLLLSDEQRTFKLVLTSSDVVMDGLLTGDNGKQIMSRHSQETLGSWILSQVFQLSDYEPLTRAKLDILGLDGIKLSRLGNRQIGLDFVKVREDDLEFLWPHKPELFLELASPVEEDS